MIFILRHVHAGNRSGWPGPDHKRPISPKGVEQTKTITEYLVRKGATQIFTSPSLRCIQTVAPLAHALNIQYIDLPELAEGASPEGAAALLRTAQDGTVICSHGDVLTSLVGHLAAHGAPVDPKTVIEKGAIWRLKLDDAGHITSAKYIPPPKV
jgi:broad specificity phosphatase PhoE